MINKYGNNSPDKEKLIDVFNTFTDTLQHLGFVIGIVIIVSLIIISVLHLHKKAELYTNNQITILKKSGKYIPGIFVELNESKDVFRFFVYGRKWKKRLIDIYNNVYDNYYGTILKDGNIDGLSFRIGQFADLKTIETVIDTSLEYHKRFSKDKVKLKEEYRDSKYLFEVIYYPYIDVLQTLQCFAKAAAYNYMVLTGSAGNGKTNLLCSIAELTIKLGECVVFINARDIVGSVDEYILKCLGVHNFWLKFKDAYWGVINLQLLIARKHLYIIIDAVNENDQEGFAEGIRDFVNNMAQFPRINIIVSCRNEYYIEKYEKYLCNEIVQHCLVYDLKTDTYPVEAIDRIITKYREHFCYTGYVSNSVRHILCEHLLLFRLFFEVNKNKDEDAISIQKYELFEEYINTVQSNGAPNINSIINCIVDSMLETMAFNSIDTDQLISFSKDELDKTYDETVLLSKTIICHEGTIAKTQKEVVQFVFDEIRDYCIARRIIQKASDTYSVDCDKIIQTIKSIKDSNAPCEEGVLQYTYIFLRTDNLICENDRKHYCNDILSIYKISDNHNNRLYYGLNHREEFQNYGLKILISSGLPLLDFEIDYIQDCLKKAPYEDAGKLFDTALTGTIENLNFNLRDYLSILFGMGDKESVYKVFSSIITHAHTFITDIDLPFDLIKFHKQLVEKNFDNAEQIQIIAELFMLLFKINDEEKEFDFEQYFESLPNHHEIKEKVKSYVRTLE